MKRTSALTLGLLFMVSLPVVAATSPYRGPFVHKQKGTSTGPRERCLVGPGHTKIELFIGKTVQQTISKANDISPRRLANLITRAYESTEINEPTQRENAPVIDIIAGIPGVGRPIPNYVVLHDGEDVTRRSGSAADALLRIVEEECTQRPSK